MVLMSKGQCREEEEEEEEEGGQRGGQGAEELSS